MWSYTGYVMYKNYKHMGWNFICFMGKVYVRTVQMYKRLLFLWSTYSVYYIL